MEKTKTELLEEIKSLKEANERLQAKINEQLHLANAIDSKDKEINSLSQNISTKFQRQLEEKETIVKKLISYIQAYQQTYRSYLKTMQGSLENAVELEALISEKLTNK